MPKQPETRFKEWIQERLACIPHSWWVKTQMLATLGIPDILGCVNGHFVALELKKDAKEVRKKRGRIKLQRHVLRAIKKAGGYAAVVCPETADDILAELLDIAEDFRSEIFHTEESHHYLYPEEESEGDSN